MGLSFLFPLLLSFFFLGLFFFDYLLGDFFGDLLVFVKLHTGIGAAAT
jgi:hypothetical protein